LGGEYRFTAYLPGTGRLRRSVPAKQLKNVWIRMGAGKQSTQAHYKRVKKLSIF
jgi:hypothetical protein